MSGPARRRSPAPPALVRKGLRRVVVEPLPEEADFSRMILMFFRDDLMDGLVRGEIGTTAEDADPLNGGD